MVCNRQSGLLKRGKKGNHLVVYPTQLEIFLSENDNLTVPAIDIYSESNA